MVSLGAMLAKKAYACKQIKNSKRKKCPHLLFKMPLTADPSMAIPRSSTFSSFSSALTSLPPPTTTSLTSIWSEKKGTSQYSPELPETPDENSSEKIGLSLVSEPGPEEGEFEAEMLSLPIELKGDPGSMSSLKLI